MLLKITCEDKVATFDIDDGPLSLEGRSATKASSIRIVTGDKTSEESFNAMVAEFKCLRHKVATFEVPDRGISLEFDVLAVYSLWDIKLIDIFGKLKTIKGE